MRVLLKLSGEALAGESGKGFDENIVSTVGYEVKKLIEKNIEVGVVIGGGNFWRGRTGNEIRRSKSDQIGMLATVMNCIYVSDIWNGIGLDTAVFTSFTVGAFTELYSYDKVTKALADKKICFFAGGTGHPYFSTDTGAALRAVETECDMILLAKAIDGVYDSDPKTNPDAKKYDTISIQEVVDNKLGVIDLTASILVMENKIPLKIFALNEKDSIINAVGDGFNGTTVTV
ncbi:MAG: UMP kinase [Lachnospiraceae bacterium]|jgi:uridylate kinase|nr:UMP kinase [Lachnospiraceae bacterium]